MLRRLMFVELPLDQASRVGPRPHQIFASVVQLILVELELGLGDIKLFLQTVLTGAAGGGKLPLELINALLVRFNLCLGLARMFVERPELRVGLRRMAAGIPQRIMKR